MEHETLPDNFTPDKINPIQDDNMIGVKGNDKSFGSRILCLSSCCEVVEIVGSNIILENPVEPLLHFISASLLHCSSQFP
jgi:hypothetical protein